MTGGGQLRDGHVVSIVENDVVSCGRRRAGTTTVGAGSRFLILKVTQQNRVVQDRYANK